MKKNKLFRMMILMAGITLVFAFTACDILNGGNEENVSGSSDGSNNTTPIAADFTISGTGTVYFDGDYKSATVAPKTGKSGGAVTVYYQGTDSTEYEKNETAPYGFGTYAVTFDVAAATGWNAASGLSAGTLTVSDGTPATPTGVNIAIASTTSLRVSWTTVPRASSYKVFYITEDMEELALAGTVTGNSYTHTGLTLNLEDIYFYYITAVNAYGESDYSTFKSVVIDKPVAPQAVEATATSSSAITLRWSSVTGATSYKIWYSAPTENSVKAELPPGTFTGTSTNITSGYPNTTYYFFVKAVNAMGESDFSPAGSAKTFGPPNNNIGISAQYNSLVNWITVRVTKLTTISQYEDLIFLYTTDSPDNPKRYCESLDPYFISLGKTSFDILQPAYNTTYYFWATRASSMASAPSGQSTNYWYSIISPSATGIEKFESPDGYSPVAIVRTGSPPPPPPPTPPTPLPPKATTEPEKSSKGTKPCPSKYCNNGVCWSHPSLSIGYCDRGYYQYTGDKCVHCNGTAKCPRCNGTGKI